MRKINIYKQCIQEAFNFLKDDYNLVFSFHSLFSTDFTFQPIDHAPPTIEQTSA